MLVLKSGAQIDPEKKEKLRNEVKTRTGEDCIILDMGLEISEIKTKKEQPLWRRLFRKN